MMPGIGGPLNNSGSMPISGGDAKSGNGDQVFRNQSSFGGLNYNSGISPWMILAGVGLFLMVMYAKK